MNRYLIPALFALLSAGAQADRFRPDVDVNVPAEVFSSGGQRAQPCNQCCIYQDQNYSEGAVVKADGVLLQCQRDERTISTNPLVWRRVKEQTLQATGYRQALACRLAPLRAYTTPAHCDNEPSARR